MSPRGELVWRELLRSKAHQETRIRENIVFVRVRNIRLHFAYADLAPIEINASGRQSRREKSKLR